MKKCPIGFFAFLLFVATASFSSCSSKTNNNNAPDFSGMPVIHLEGGVDTFEITTVTMDTLKRKGFNCNNDSITIKKIVPHITKKQHVVNTEGSQIAGEEYLRLLGEKNDIDIAAHAKTTPVVIPEPVDPSNGDDASAKKSSKREPWDFSLGNDLFKLLCYILGAILLVCLVWWLVTLLAGASERNRRNRIDNPDNGGGNQNLKDNNLNLPARGTGSASFKAPMPGVKKTVIEETRKVTHYYDDNRS